MDRKIHWEKIYTDKSPFDVSWYQKEPMLSLQLIHGTGVAKDAYMIDVGGGASVLVDHLIDEDFPNVTVLDIAAGSLAYAKERLGEKARAVKWIEADVTEFVAPHQFDLWHDRAVFHFLTEATDRRKYVEVLERSLMVGGHLIIATFAAGGPTKCSGLNIVQYDAKKLQGELGRDFVFVEERALIHITPTKREQKFAYFRFTKQGA